MPYQTLRFGSIECAHEDIISVPNGVTPFIVATRYVILSDPEEEPFSWLQSLDDPALAFVVAPLGLLFPEYTAEVLRDHAPADVDEESDTIALLGIVVLDPDPDKLTVNLLAPLLVDFSRMEARQLVLDGPIDMARERLAEAIHAEACV